ncbi:ABC transporter permease [Timonella sp. A28]|uniref:ABC transporter permease n=1 Tax=Timonella sp. A28 TaxID=3442640 RepID=UPI003EB6C8CB
MATSTEHTAFTPAPDTSMDKTPRFTWHGVKTVTTLELTQRLRSSKWRIALLIWFLGVGAICLLIAGATASSMTGSTQVSHVGPMIFGVNVYFILFMGLLITPTLASTAINGDRASGTLAILQASLLTPLEIAVGKLLASWISAMAFLIISVPFIVWSLGAGGVKVWSVVAVLAAMSFVLLVVCAVSLYMSARMAKTATSTVMSYLYVAFVSGILVVLFGVSMVVFMNNEEVKEMAPNTYSEITGHPKTCAVQDTYDQSTPTEAFWWLLAPNPFVIVADVSVLTNDAPDYYVDSDPLASVSHGVRTARVGEGISYNEAWCREDGSVRSVEEAEALLNQKETSSPVWPWGLAINLVIGAAALYGTQRRLKAPYRQLPKGIRIA